MKAKTLSTSGGKPPDLLTSLGAQLSDPHYGLTLPCSPCSPLIEPPGSATVTTDHRKDNDTRHFSSVRHIRRSAMNQLATFAWNTVVQYITFL